MDLFEKGATMEEDILRVRERIEETIHGIIQ